MLVTILLDPEVLLHHGAALSSLEEVKDVDIRWYLPSTALNILDQWKERKRRGGQVSSATRFLMDRIVREKRNLIFSGSELVSE